MPNRGIAILDHYMLDDQQFPFGSDGIGKEYLWQVKITSDSTKVDEGLDVAYFDLSLLPSSAFTHMAEDGGDIRVYQSDGTTEVARDVVWVDTESQAGELHVDTSGMSSSEHTDWYIRYGSGASDYIETDTYGRNAAWPSDVMAIYSMANDPSGVAPQGVDRTGNGNDGTIAGSMTTSDLISSIVGKAWDHDGTDDMMDTGIGSLTPPITLEILCRSHDATQDAMLLSNFNSTTDNDLYLRHYGSIGHWQLRCDGADDGIEGGNPSANTWALLHGILDSGSQDLYVDGSPVGSAGGTTTTHDSGGNFYTCGRPSVGENFDGDVALAGIYSTSQSGNWAATRRNNLMDNASFWTVGSEEEL